MSCLTCGHKILVHYPNNEPCITPGCICTRFEAMAVGDIEGNPLPDEEDQAPRSDFAPPPDLQQAIHAARHPFQWGAIQTANWCDRLDCHRPLDDAIHAPDPAWDDDAPEPPLHERVPWRIGVLDKDLFESPQEVQENALLVAGWYVSDCAGLLEQLQTAQAARDHAADLMWDLEQQLQAAQAENQQLRELLEQASWFVAVLEPDQDAMELVAKIHAALGQVDQP